MPFPTTVMCLALASGGRVGGQKVSDPPSLASIKRNRTPSPPKTHNGNIFRKTKQNRANINHNKAVVHPKEEHVSSPLQSMSSSSEICSFHKFLSVSLHLYVLTSTVNSCWTQLAVHSSMWVKASNENPDPCYTQIEDTRK